MSEDVGDVGVCVQFSTKFVKPFEILLNTSSEGNISIGEKCVFYEHILLNFTISTAQLGVDYSLPRPLMVSSEDSGNGEVCLNLTIVDDVFAETVECLFFTVFATEAVVPISDSFCIIDNDGKYLVLA